MLHLGSPRRVKFRGQKLNYAPVAELADAYGSGPYFLTGVQVRFLSGAPTLKAFIDAALSVFLCLKILLKTPVTYKKTGAQHKIVRLPIMLIL